MKFVLTKRYFVFQIMRPYEIQKLEETSYRFVYRCYGDKDSENTILLLVRITR